MWLTRDHLQSIDSVCDTIQAMNLFLMQRHHMKQCICYQCPLPTGNHCSTPIKPTVTFSASLVLTLVFSKASFYTYFPRDEILLYSFHWIGHFRITLKSISVHRCGRLAAKYFRCVGVRLFATLWLLVLHVCYKGYWAGRSINYSYCSERGSSVATLSFLAEYLHQNTVNQKRETCLRSAL